MPNGDIAQQVLAPVQVDDTTKAQAWQAFKDSTNANDFAQQIGSLNLPQDVKAKLWAAKNVSQPTQFEQQRSPANQQGLLGGAVNEIETQGMGLLKSLYPNRSNLYGLAGPGGVLAPAENAVQTLMGWQNRTQQGRSVPYKTLTAVPQLAGIPTGAAGEEQAAETGDTGGVLGHAAVPIAEALAGPALHAVGARMFRPASAPIPETVGTPEAAAETGGTAPTPNAGPTPTPKASAAQSAPVEAGPGAKFAQTLGITDPEPTALLTKAVKPLASNTGWDKAIASAAPDMKAVEPQMGKPIEGVDDALQAVNLAKKGIWSQYAAKLDEAQAKFPNAPSMATIDGNDIADAMMGSIDKRTQIQNPGLVKQIQSVADTYRRPLSLAEAEDFLQSTNNDLHNYYAKNKVGQQVAQRDPSMGYVVAEGNALRNALYSTLDDLTGPGAAQLKQRYGALSNIEDALLRRKNVAARQQPESLAEQLSMARGIGKIAMGAARLDPFTALEGTQSVAAAKWLKARGTTDAMISRAFQALGPNGTPVTPTPAPVNPSTFSAPISGGMQTNTDLFDPETLAKWKQDHGKL